MIPTSRHLRRKFHRLITALSPTRRPGQLVITLLTLTLAWSLLSNESSEITETDGNSTTSLNRDSDEALFHHAIIQSQEVDPEPASEPEPASDPEPASEPVPVTFHPGRSAQIHDSATDPEPETAEWAADLYSLFQSADDRFEGEVGVYVKDLSSGQTLSFRADEDWYLASGIKVPVAIEVLRQIDEGRLTLEDTITLKATDYVDGAGQTNWSPAGTLFTISHLLGEMLQVSDNTATDLLIRKVGIERVNQLVREVVADRIGEITTLADVRRHAYGHLHPEAFNLVGYDFIQLRQAQGDQNRLLRLAELVGIDRADFHHSSLDDAYAAYYASRLNGGQLSAFGDLMEALLNGALLSPESTRYLMELLQGVRTGDHRIKAGLPEGVTFAHKTGTQRGRTCDLGVAEVTGGRQIIIAACTRGTLSRGSAEQALRAVGEAVTQSGLLNPVPETDLITEVEADG